MCGIAGIYEAASPVSRQVLGDMAGELLHRGPDGVGLYMDGRFGMVNTRLSIVDLEGGDQPLSNETGRYWVMQNGEIYNAPELTTELEDLGHTFATRCDTEVLVHAFEQWGAACLDRFNGPFAFAIWDRLTSELFLARDRLGIRPLFVAWCGRTLVFGSEAKAILRHPECSRQLDASGLVETLTTWSTGPDRSAFAGIRELSPGHYLRVGRDGTIEERVWWSPDFSEDGQRRPESDLQDELLELLRDSTRLRLRADVPVAAYLSGGVDSSLTAAMVGEVSRTPLKTFAVRFDDSRFDESRWQQLMARQLGTDHESVVIHPQDIAATIPDVVTLAEKPLLRTAPAPLLLLSRLVRSNGIKVVLTGEGADEFFGGYNIFREDKVRRFWARQPDSAFRPRLLEKLYPYLARDLGRTHGFLKAFFGRELNNTHDPFYSHRIRFRNTSRIVSLLTPQVLDAAGSPSAPLDRLLDRLPANFNSFPALGKAQYLETVTFLQGYLLHSQGDRMLMGNSIEGRFPFLDHRVVEFAATLPSRMKIRGMQEKHLLRKAAQQLIPREITNRSKQPYRAPILRAFFGPDAPDYSRELLSTDHLTNAGLFDSKRVGALVDRCTRSADNGVSETDEMAIIAVVSTMLLNRQFIESPRLHESVEPSRIVIGDNVVRRSTGCLDAVANSI